MRGLWSIDVRILPVYFNDRRIALEKYPLLTRLYDKNSLPLEDFIEALRELETRGVFFEEPIIISSFRDLAKLKEKLNGGIDALIINIPLTDVFLRVLSTVNKPIIVFGEDTWRIISYLRDILGIEHVISPFNIGIDDVGDAFNKTVRYLRCLKVLTQGRILYIGRFEPHLIYNAVYDISYIKSRLGVDVIVRSVKDYINTLSSIEVEDARGILDSWSNKVNYSGFEEEALLQARIYLALRKMLREFDCQGVTIVSYELPSPRYIPTLAASMLIEDGIAINVYGDIPQLISMMILMSLSRKPAIPGRLLECRELDNRGLVIDEGYLTFTSDIIPPSLTKYGMIEVYDYHNMGEGVSVYGEVKEDVVTLVGLRGDLNLIQVISGKVTWTKRTINARTTLALETYTEAEDIAMCLRASGYVLTIGDYIEDVNSIASLLKVRSVTY